MDKKLNNDLNLLGISAEKLTQKEFIRGNEMI
jgi:hypothetical protein